MPRGRSALFPTLATSLAALSLSLTLTQPAQSAGLGRLSVLSALGQPLRAEVDVTSVSREEAASMTARLAPAEAFRLAGVDYSPVLSTLRFSIANRSDGRSIIRITSLQPVDEPVVDLLVELNWAGGRLVRKYTFLLDPPEIKLEQRAIVRGDEATDTAAPVAVEGDTRQTAASRATAPAGAASRTAGPRPPASRTAPPADAPVAAARSNPSAAAQPPAARPSAPAPQAPTAAAPATPSSAGPVPGTVVVREGETIATVANRTRPAAIHIDQAIIALYRANPAAFFGSVHLLKAGATLNVPDEQTMASVDRTAARNEIRGIRGSQEAARPADALPASAVAARPASVDAPQAAASAAPTPAAPSSAELLRVARSRIAELERTVDTLRKEVDEADLRIAELQKQLTGRAPSPAPAADMRSADAVGASAAAVSSPQSPVASSPSSPIAPSPSSPPAASSVPSPASAPAASPSPPSPTSASAAASSSSPLPASAPAASPSLPQPAPAGAASTAPPASASAAAPAAAPASSAPAASVPAPPAAGAPASAATAPAGGVTTLIDDLLAEPAIPVGGAALLAAVLGGLAYRARRRGKTAAADANPADAGDEPVNSLFGTTAHEDFDANAATDTRDSEAAFHSTEIDPISEAEVYVAYGRQSQAEEILRNALRGHPDRQPVRLRLMELLAARNDRTGFAALAGEMFDKTGGRNEEWPKAVTLGLMVDPDNPIYTGWTTQDLREAKLEPAARLEPAATPEPAAAPKGGLDFVPTPLPDPAPAPTTASLAAEAPADVSNEPTAPAELDIPLAFELPAPIEISAALESPSATDEPVSPASMQGEESELLLPPTLTFDAPETDIISPMSERKRHEQFDTALELGLAYHELGDREGVREMLRDVLESGTDAQKLKARQILAKAEGTSAA